MKLNKPVYLPGEVLEDGSLYVGVINDNNKIYHLSLEPEDEPKKMHWFDAITHERCPTLREMKLISANAFALGLSKNNDSYWSSTEYNNNYAWYERFSDGYQNVNFKNNGYLIRCVRRYIIRDNTLILELNDLKEKIKTLEKKLK